MVDAVVANYPGERSGKSAMRRADIDSIIGKFLFEGEIGGAFTLKLTRGVTLRAYLERNEDFKDSLLASWDLLSEKHKKKLAEFNITPYCLENSGRLKKDFNIEHFTRYPEDVLRDMLSGTRKKDQPLAIVAFAKEDKRSSFYADTIGALRKKGYFVVAYEAENEGKFVEMGDKLSKKYGKASLFVIVGHGDPHAITLDSKTNSEKDTLDISDNAVMKRMRGWLDYGTEFAKTKPQIILISCSTGRISDAHNIAQFVSEQTGTEVFAPEKDTRIDQYDIGKYNGRLRIERVHYWKCKTAKYDSGKLVDSE